MMEGLREAGIRHSYTGKGDRILKELLLPALEVAVAYDRVTSYYSIGSLLAISQGVQSLYERGGSMRLIIGVHCFPPDIVEAIAQREYLKTQIDLVRHSIERGLATITDTLTRHRLATLAWMIEDGLLEVKAAAVKGEGEGIFHPKTLLFRDAQGDEVAAVGSSNETASGLGGNFEQLMVATSWETPDAIEDQRGFFQALWTGTCDDAVVQDVREDLAEVLRKALGDDARRCHPATADLDSARNVLALAAQMPANFFVSGIIPALYQHQERAVVQALSRWPVRVLFADEVGLGKTFEVAASMAFLMKFCSVRRVLIMTPKSVLRQWQDELEQHFGIEAWLFDSQRKAYVNEEGKLIRMGSRNPLGNGSPDVMLMSAQYARGGAGRKDVFSRAGTILPDLLVLDEAHSARVSVGISGKHTSTRMYRMLESVVSRIPHVIFATATPMQRDAEEYHALLKLLGLPKKWQSPSNYRTSLKLAICDELTSHDDAAKAGRLIMSMARMMKPSLDALTVREREAIEGLLSLGVDAGGFTLARFVLGSWTELQGAFVKLHPAHLLTVRNTRSSLEQIGYRFPHRELREVAVDTTSQVQLFYLKVNEYLDSWYFSVERQLYPDRKFNVGFVRVSYQQRVSSSLWSCRKSLVRRLERLLSLRTAMASQGLIDKRKFDGFSQFEGLDGFDEDSLLELGDESMLDEIDVNHIDVGKLSHAIDLECTTLQPLITRAGELLAQFGDQKVIKSVAIAFKHLARGDQVLLFSRYTDTVDALIDEIKRANDHSSFVFGIYVGSESAIVSSGEETPCSKTDIKRGLDSGLVRLMVCSDAASEGLNLQAARVLINVDVPWTPARLEQRIGRVARLGQRAASVDIYNVWYPDSIESHMYQRIQKRLDEALLAVGEYPDVVADNIKALVFDEIEREDAGLERLSEIRESLQVEALSKLWSQQDSKVTSSKAVRRGLMNLCDMVFPCAEVRHDGAVRVYDLPDGQVALTDEEGTDEAISFSSAPWKQTDFNIGGYGFVRDTSGNPSAFVRLDEPKVWVAHESLPDLVAGASVRELPYTSSPTMLPTFDALNLSYAVDGEVPTRPTFWPPMGRE